MARVRVVVVLLDTSWTVWSSCFTAYEENCSMYNNRSLMLFLVFQPDCGVFCFDSVACTVKQDVGVQNLFRLAFLGRFTVQDKCKESRISSFTCPK